MQQIATDPTKSAVIQAVAAALAGTDLAAQAVCELQLILPVYYAGVPTLEEAVSGYLAYVRGEKPMPEWVKKGTAA